MDKKVMFACAGSGKTTYIIDNLSAQKRSLIVTYTDANYKNICKKIQAKFNGLFPENICVMTYFSFLYRFCYKPFLSDEIKAKGIIYENNQKYFAKSSNLNYYKSNSGYLYSNRIAMLIIKYNVVDLLKQRLESYFDEFIIDEIQDIAGRDFALLEELMTANVNMLFVGDFYQHTFDTSRDGNFNSKLFNNKNDYEKRFSNKGITIDDSTLNHSWRCSKTVCDFIRENIGIEIYSHRDENSDTSIEFISNQSDIDNILNSSDIIKLHYKNSSIYGNNHRNWGETKGEDDYNDVCVMLNKTSADKYRSGRLYELPQSTKNKLYVAITRAHGNVYLINE